MVCSSIPLAVLLCVLVARSQAGMQSVGIRGTLMCGDTPLSKVVVKLWDHNDLLPDHVLGCGHTNEDGTFEVWGKEEEISEVNPYFEIYTNCNDEMLWGEAPKPCERKIKMTIPKDYVNTGDEVTNWFEAGTLNMEAKQDDEKRKCDIFDPCERKIKLTIPKEYINRASKVSNWYEVGILNLEAKQEHEKRKCDISEVCDPVSTQ